MEKLNPPFGIMLVDDEEMFLRSARVALASSGFTNVITVSDSRTVLEKLSTGSFGVIALDITMPYMSGTELLAKITAQHPEVIVIMITGANDVNTAVTCMKNGSFDYILKPLSEEKLVGALRRAVEHREMRDEAAALKHYILTGKLEHPEAFDGIVTQSQAMFNIFKYAEAVADTGLPVLVSGETGVGKELVARAIHIASGRTGQYLPVNIGGLDDTMVADTLFGHTRGAFTGADKDRKGLVEEAANGTLFLDEIGDLRAECQVKLLRLLQEGTYFQLGSDHPRRSRARIVAATNRDLASSTDFRRDLYYRLHAHQITVPPLRERREDIPLLARWFCKQAASAMHMDKSPAWPPEIDTILTIHPFAGNVRELESLVSDAVAQAKMGRSIAETLRSRLHLSQPVAGSDDTAPEMQFGATLPTLRVAEELLIKEAIQRTNGNKSLAAVILGTTRQTLTNKLRTDKLP